MPGDDVANLAAVGLDSDRIGFDCDCFLGCAHLHREINAGTVGDVQDYVLPLDDLEPRGVGLNVVFANGQIRSHILTGFISLQRTTLAGFDAGDGDGRVRYHRARGIGNRADDGSFLSQS